MLALLFCCNCRSYSNVRVSRNSPFGYVLYHSTRASDRTLPVFAGRIYSYLCVYFPGRSLRVALLGYIRLPPRHSTVLEYSHSSTTSTSLRELFVEEDLPSIRSGGLKGWEHRPGYTKGLS